MGAQIMVGRARRKESDPVCGADINGKNALSLEHDGNTYHFCSEECMAAFKAHPERFTKGLPRPAQLPAAAWINAPKSGTAEAPTVPANRGSAAVAMPADLRYTPVGGPEDRATLRSDSSAVGRLNSRAGDDSLSALSCFCPAGSPKSDKPSCMREEPLCVEE